MSNPTNLDPDIAALLEMVQAGTESGARIPFPQLAAAQARADFDASSPLLDVDPPALSPPTATRPASSPAARPSRPIQASASTASSKAVGNLCSGASR